MSNQRITSLPPLSASQVTGPDLFIIVDRNDPSSPTGDTKNISAGELASYIASAITPGNTAAQPVFQATHSFQIGSVIRMDAGSQLFVTASANSTTGLEAEVAGIVNNVIDENNFVLTAAGYVNFVNPPYWLPTPPTGSAALEIGVTYFLGDLGILQDTDPSVTTSSSWISKPYMTAVGPLTGIVTNYRGFYQTGADTNAVTLLYVTSPNSFLPGDAVRKTLASETASLGNWVLASADTYQLAEVAGVVNAASPSFFSLSLTGHLTGLSNLEVGETYYLVPSASINYTASIGPKNLQPYDITVCSQYSKPVFVAISPTDAIVFNQRSSPDAGMNTCGEGGSSLLNPYTYGPMAYPSLNPPTNAQVVTFLSTILPNAENNSSALVYWIPTNISSNITSYHAFKNEGGWTIT